MLLAVGLTLVSCRSGDNMSYEVKKQLESGATEVDFNRIADFRWEILRVDGPIVDDKEYCDGELKLPEDYCSQGYYQLLFGNRDGSFELKTIRRKIANFDEHCLKKPIPRNASTFAIERRPETYLVCRSDNNRQ
jgi:hypothetical protein